jgi:hypothetical protein
MTCLGTNMCEHAPSMVQLVDGSTVCSNCPEWRNECEARRLLQMPLAKRREELQKRINERGQAAVDNLKAAMTALFEKDKE